MDGNIKGYCKGERLVWGPKGKAFSKILNLGNLGPTQHSFSHLLLIQRNLSEQTIHGYMS